MGKHEKLDGKARVAKHRAAMRAQGYRLKQVWVPDVTSPEFIAQARREARLIAASPHEEHDQAFIDSISIPWDELLPYDTPIGDEDPSEG